MSTREVMIVVAHAHFCEPCRSRLLSNPDAVFLGRALTDDEKISLAGLSAEDFFTPERLAHATGSSVEALDEYRNHPVARLRHF